MLPFHNLVLFLLIILNTSYLVILVAGATHILKAKIRNPWGGWGVWIFFETTHYNNLKFFKDNNHITLGC